MTDEKIAVYIELWHQKYKANKMRKQQEREMIKDRKREDKTSTISYKKYRDSFQHDNLFHIKDNAKKICDKLKMITKPPIVKKSSEKSPMESIYDGIERIDVNQPENNQVTSIVENKKTNLAKKHKRKKPNLNKIKEHFSQNRKYKKYYGLLLLNILLVVLLAAIINVLGRTGSENKSYPEIHENVEKGTLNEPKSKTRETEEAKDLTDTFAFDSSMINITAVDGKKLHPAIVRKVVDGDTLICNINGKDEYVRFNLIDTPESVNPDITKNTEFGEYASEHTKNLVKVGETVYLQYDEVERDVYDRILAYVWLRDGVNVEKLQDIQKYMLNYIILADGYAKVLMVNNKAYEGLFYEVERITRNRKIGLFRYNDYRKVS